MTYKSNRDYDDLSEEEKEELRDLLPICGVLSRQQREAVLKRGRIDNPIFSTPVNRHRRDKQGKSTEFCLDDIPDFIRYPYVKRQKDEVGVIGWFKRLFKKGS